jgi:glycosyltransferase involved in cell wall biosynthesis
MPEPISVLHLINEFVDGSISRIVDRIILNSDRNSFRWHVGAVKPYGDYATQFINNGAQTICFSKSGQDHVPIYMKVSDYIDYHHIQIVHSHTPRTILEVWRSVLINKQKGVAHLATKHLLTTPKDRKYGLFFTSIDLLSLYLPDYIVTVSNTMAEKVRSLPGIDHKRISSIPNGIPCDEYYQPQLRNLSRKEMGITDDQILIGYNGRISKVKRLDLLLHAFQNIHAKYPQTHLVLAGDGTLRENLELMTGSLQLNNCVTWLGYYAEIPKLLAAIDIYVQSSVNEGLSLSILEAMAAEKPVISTYAGSASEIIKDGFSGILVPQGSDVVIEKALAGLIEQPLERKRLALNAKAFVLQNYNQENMVTRYYQVYRRIISEWNRS